MDLEDNVADVSRNERPQTPFYDLPRQRVPGKPFSLGLARVLPNMPESQGALVTTPRHRLRCLSLARDLAHSAEVAAKAYAKQVEVLGTPRTARHAAKVAPAASPASTSSVTRQLACEKEALILRDFFFAKQALCAKQNDREYQELLAEAAGRVSKQDWPEADRF